MNVQEHDQEAQATQTMALWLRKIVEEHCQQHLSAQGPALVRSTSMMSSYSNQQDANWTQLFHQLIEEKASTIKFIHDKLGSLLRAHYAILEKLEQEPFERPSKDALKAYDKLQRIFEQIQRHKTSAETLQKDLEDALIEPISRQITMLDN